MAHARVGVVMAGGSGERFWPLSTPSRPKQLLCLTNPHRTMLEESIERLRNVLPDDHLYLSISNSLKEPILASGAMPVDRILVEPAKRNTLGALCWVVASLLARGFDDPTIAVVTADHRIENQERFQRTVVAALEIAEDYGGIVTIGVPPTRPETGYGYIEIDDRTVRSREGRVANRAAAFREKPSPLTAEEYVAAGRFLWNSGTFFFSASTFLRELAHSEPEIHANAKRMIEALQRGEESAAVKLFERLPNISVDYAVMERAKCVYTLRADFGWDDVGAWDAMERCFPSDGKGNVVQGNAVVLESEDCIVFNDDGEGTVGVLGVRDIVVVKTKDAVLVCRKNQAQRVRLVVQAIQNRQK